MIIGNVREGSKISILNISTPWIINQINDQPAAEFISVQNSGGIFGYMPYLYSDIYTP